MIKFSTAIAAALLANPAQAGDWTVTIDVDSVAEYHTLETKYGTCRIGFDGFLMVEVVTTSGKVHRGYFMQNGRTPAERPQPLGNPMGAFRLAGCADAVPTIPSEVVRCQWMFHSIGPGRVTNVDYDRFSCPVQR